MEFSFFSMIAQASLVAKAVLAFLVIMSIGSWGLMIQKFIGLSAANRKALSGTERFEKAANLREAVQSLGSDPTSPLYYIAHQGVLEFNRSKELGNSSEVVVDNVRRALRQGVGTELARLQSSLSVLATCANTAPFIGLFGTVWGIMSSFHSIGMLKSASLATVAPGISEALVATAIGLAVAVPATIGFNIFMGKLSQVDTLLVNFAGVFLNRVQREINAHRQETEQQIFKAAEELLEQQPERLDDRIMLLWGRDWHPGVIGIVASRLVERTGRPVIVVTIDEHGEGKGSGRSVQGFNLHACIGSCADLLVRYGGHAMAAGLSVREENLPELRRRLNEWAARECPVLHTPPLTCDVTIHLDRITVESVRHLDQLAPYGAENPTPVFLLQSAVVDGVYPVSEGRHSRLRLRQGNSCLYAVWFGMPAEQLPYALGDVVDVALNLSVYESARGAQLSGRIIDLHPAGLGAELARQAALVQALRRGTPLTEEQKKQIVPARTDIIAVYRELQSRRWHAEDLQPLCAKLGEEQTGKTLVAVAALEQVGLITAAEKGGAKFWELVPTAGKKNLADAPILKCLEEL